MKSMLRGGITSLVMLAAFVSAPVLRAQANKPTKMKASAIKVEMIHSDEIKLPAESTLSFLLIDPVTVTQQTAANHNTARTPLQ